MFKRYKDIMIPYLFHIYGPIYANCYGLAILVGVLTLIYMANKDKKLSKIVTKDQLINIVIFGTVIGIFGGMLLWAMNNWGSLYHWSEIFEIWNGGFSILGTVVAIVIILPIYLKRKNIPVMQFLDRITIYTPLTQSISRIGCFFAGCCYGAKTECLLGVTYTHQDSGAPLFTKIHPAQLYSSLALFLIFLLMYFVLQKYLKKEGQLFSISLLLIAIERFVTDFIRADREFSSMKELSFLSINQWIAIVIAFVAFCLLIYYTFYKKPFKKLT